MCVADPKVRLTILSGKLFITTFNAAQKPASLPIPNSAAHKMRVNNVPPPAGFVLPSHESYTAFIPRYPLKSRTKERAREGRGPLESASFPSIGPSVDEPSVGDFSEFINIW